MPWTKALAQFPTPARASRIFATYLLLKVKIFLGNDLKRVNLIDFSLCYLNVIQKLIFCKLNFLSVKVKSFMAGPPLFGNPLRASKEY